MAGQCPICKGEVAKGRPENPAAPFCSQRCKLVDLGKWLGGDYAIPAGEDEPSEEELLALHTRSRLS